MKSAPFTYHAPCTIDEATALLNNLSAQDAYVLAGGQSLVPAMALRLARPNHLIDINGITGLDDVIASDQDLVIGALVRHARFQSPQGLGPLAGPLCDVVQHIAHYPIRQRGTFCGSLVHCDPSSEWCLVAATFDGVVTLAKVGGRREVDISEFFMGTMTTAVEADELVTQVRLQQISATACWGFEEFAMRAGDFAVAMALVTFDVADGVVRDARIGIGGVEATPRRIEAGEAAVNGVALDGADFTKVGDIVAQEIVPLDDWQASGDERRSLANVLVVRALQRAKQESS